MEREPSIVYYATKVGVTLEVHNDTSKPVLVALSEDGVNNAILRLREELTRFRRIQAAMKRESKRTS